MNCRSIKINLVLSCLVFVKNKKAEIHILIDSAKPDIILGKYFQTPLMQSGKKELVMHMVVFHCF